MKHIKVCLAALMLAAVVAMPVKAQTLTTVANSITVPASLSNDVSAVSSSIIPITYTKDVHLQLRFKLMASGTSPITLFFDSSNDAANWKTSTLQLNATANGTSEVLLVTNLTVNALPYLRLNIIHNTNAAIVTNLTLTANTKRGL